MDGNFGLLRSRWAAIGAAVAVSFGAGGLFTVLAAPSTAPSEYIAIAPCRLADTRAPFIGPKVTPFGANETFTYDVRGANGQCTIPATATAVTANITVINGSTQSFLTVYPTDIGLPNASTINWKAGQTPLANGATLNLSGNGKINVNNNAGTVNVAIDITGYFQPSSPHEPIQLNATFPITAGSSSFSPVGASSASALMATVAWMVPRDCTMTNIRARIFGSITAGTLVLDVSAFSTNGSLAGSSSTTAAISTSYVSGAELSMGNKPVLAGQRVTVGQISQGGAVSFGANTTAHISMTCI